ncbi:MAG: glucosamine-6-phosphate deaminase [Clostridiales bacterium]|nr:glucosamine-6-phosphate deaminase [Clostridiales bacterium]
MKIFIGTQEEIAKKAAQRYVDLLKEKPNAILGHATGSTPLGLYAELIKLNKEGALTYKDVTSFNLDEYVGLDGSHDQSYRYFMNENLFNHIDIDLAKTFVPSGLDTSAETAANYDKAIEAAGGIDLQLLGIGNNGHIGFNEPNTPFGSCTHMVELTESTRQANKRFFNSIDEVPTHAVTMGIKTIMNAKSIILMAIGSAKAPVIKAIVEGEVTPEIPASVLQLHPNAEIYLDYEAAALLSK